MSQLASERRSRAVQTTFDPTEKVEQLSQSKSKNGRIQPINYGSNASSRETTPTTDGSCSSGPTSVTSVTQFMQLTVEGGYQHEDAGICGGRWSNNETPPPVDRMPSIDEHTENKALDKSPPESPRSVRGRHAYDAVSSEPNSSIWLLNPKNQNSHAGPTGLEDIEDTDKNPENRDEHDDVDECGEDDDLDGEDNDWSGEDGGLEELVLSVVGGDFAFAASLIPWLHRFMTSRLRSKVQSWQSCADGGSHDSSGDGNSGISNDNKKRNAPPNSRKRRRSSEHGDNPGGGKDDDNDGEGHKQPVDDIVSPDGSKQLMLACPFNKNNSTKYCATDRKYRTCAGPGFKNIQRLREHLKRTHYPVQCERCYCIFPSNDKTRASAMDELAAHRRAEASCPRGDPSLKEGISDAQWASLDAQSRKTNKSQESHRTEKWTEIWIVLFPGKDVPTPWYENIIAETFSNHSASPSQQIEDFVNLCMAFVDHGARDLVFETGHMKTTSREILEVMIRKACILWTGMNGPIPGSQSSSSSTGNNPLSSLTNSSSTNITAPTTCAPDSHAPIQTSGSNAQPVLRSHSSDMNQPLAKRSRSGLRMRPTHSQTSSPQVTNALVNMPMPVHGLQNHFLSPMQAPLPPAPNAGAQMSMDDYTSIGSEQWSMPIAGGFTEADDLRASSMSVFSSQAWPSAGRYGTYQQTFTGGDTTYFQQTQDFGQDGDLDGDMGNIS